MKFSKNVVRLGKEYHAHFRFLLALLAFSVFSPQTAPAQTPPYPASQVIEKVTWDFSSLTRLALGSDLWPVTWADDDNLYTAWGDGVGFGAVDFKGQHGSNRAAIGVSRIGGFPTSFATTNIFGGKNAQVRATFVGKPTDILFINGVLYMGIVEERKWMRWKIGRSTDYGRTWTFNRTPFATYWDFAEPDGAFCDTSFLQFGKDYQGARDSFVYAYSQENGARVRKEITDTITMFRVPKDQIMNRSAYQYFAGLDGNSNPLWVTDITKRKPVFIHPNGVGWSVRVQYNPALKRYFLTTWHKWDGSWGIFDAPEPWGPWTTASYSNQWIDASPKFGFAFPQKWMSADGKTMWMIFSGTGIYDSFNVIKATLTLKTQDRTSPSAPSGLSAVNN
jgi:hypothetical protein